MTDPARKSVEFLHGQLLAACARVRGALKMLRDFQVRGIPLQVAEKEITESKAAALALRNQARGRRCEVAVKDVRDVLRDDPFWTSVLSELDPENRDKVQAAREKLLDVTKWALQDPPGTSYRESVQDDRPEPPAVLPVGPVVLPASRESLIAAGLVAETPASRPKDEEPIRLLEPPPWALPPDQRPIPEPTSTAPRRFCGKATYATKAKARRDAGGKGGFRLWVYHCTKCQGWHVANLDKQRHGG